MLVDRLRNQRLSGASMRRAAEVVQWFGAVQAQDYVGAKWALGLRAPALRDRSIEDAFAQGRILRTHILRPTWHFVTPADIRWMLALNATRLKRLNLTYGARLGLDANLLTRARRIVERALEGGLTLTRDELAAALARAGVAARGQRLAHLLFHLEQDAVICSGPRRGRQFTYALFGERVAASAALSPEEALAEVARRYFQSHGPATLRDFAWWSGLPMQAAREGVALAKVKVLAAPPALQRVRGATFLLPNYDEYLIAYRDRGAVIDPDRARNLGVFTSREHPHQVIVDGRVAGSWRRTITENLLLVELWPYARLATPQHEALDAQAARYAQFLGVPYELRIDTAAARPIK